MDLILWRHADAADAAAGESDHQRELTHKGHKQAQRMAAWLNAHLPADTVILASPAVRAQQTAAALKRSVTRCDALDTGAECTVVLHAVRWPKKDGVTLVVGHQPTLGHVASLLLTGAEGALSIKKGAIWWFASGRERKGHAVLRVVMSPDML